MCALLQQATESHAARAPAEPRASAPTSWHARSCQQAFFSGPSAPETRARPRAEGAPAEGIHVIRAHAPLRDARERSKSPSLDVRVGEATNPGPPDDAASRRHRTLHALAQMGRCHAAARVVSDGTQQEDNGNGSDTDAVFTPSEAATRPF